MDTHGEVQVQPLEHELTLDNYVHKWTPVWRSKENWVSKCLVSVALSTYALQRVPKHRTRLILVNFLVYMRLKLAGKLIDA
ncbi:hypothetical protein DVV91_02670 [Clostridium botulinum]|nr:hypothetical protein [Clostridium botulinum]